LEEARTLRSERPEKEVKSGFQDTVAATADRPPRPRRESAADRPPTPVARQNNRGSRPQPARAPYRCGLYVRQAGHGTAAASGRKGL